VAKGAGGRVAEGAGGRVAEGAGSRVAEEAGGRVVRRDAVNSSDTHTSAAGWVWTHRRGQADDSSSQEQEGLPSAVLLDRSCDV